MELHLRHRPIKKALTMVGARFDEMQPEGRLIQLSDLWRDFLRIPPFPGARLKAFEVSNPNSRRAVAALIDHLRASRAGGDFWKARPHLPDRYFVVCERLRDKVGSEHCGGLPIIYWSVSRHDPWHLLRSAAGLICAIDDPIARVAELLDVAAWDWTGRLKDPMVRHQSTLDVATIPAKFHDPFSRQEMDVEEVIELCSFWRTLIDSNRDIVRGLGFAFWKQPSVAPLLWTGAQDFSFSPTFNDLPLGGTIAIWRSKVPTDIVTALEQSGRSIVEVEDGFLRSRGLGADCIPPLSIIVDREGIYFDPSQPSSLERLLEYGSFPKKLLARARVLRKAVVEAGLGKYEQSDAILRRPGGDRRHILVPGQVEDDRSVLAGGDGIVSNLELLRRVRASEPNSFILYKPHPDVVAGHRQGSVSDMDVLAVADLIVGDEAIAPLLEMVDAVHVNTSLTGFEALMRGKPVTTWGVPFYAGWGLTDDRGRVPERRTVVRSLDELVAATLLLYPRYLDPITGLPCPAEVVVQRLATGALPADGLVVRLRRWQGAFIRWRRKWIS